MQQVDNTKMSFKGDNNGDGDDDDVVMMSMSGDDDASSDDDDDDDASSSDTDDSTNDDNDDDDDDDDNNNNDSNDNSDTNQDDEEDNDDDDDDENDDSGSDLLSSRLSNDDTDNQNTTAAAAAALAQGGEAQEPTSRKKPTLNIHISKAAVADATTSEKSLEEEEASSERMEPVATGKTIIETTDGAELDPSTKIADSTRTVTLTGVSDEPPQPSSTIAEAKTEVNVVSTNAARPTTQHADASVTPDAKPLQRSNTSTTETEVDEPVEAKAKLQKPTLKIKLKLDPSFKKATMSNQASITTAVEAQPAPASSESNAPNVKVEMQDDAGVTKPTDAASKATAAEDNKSDNMAVASEATIISSPPPKKKMKGHKLPTSTNRKVEGGGGGGGGTVATVKAEIVSNDTSNIKKRPSSHPHHPRPTRLPPMTSPGLLLSQQAASQYRSAIDPKTGWAYPRSIFEQSMASAGYTTEARTKRPHRGSSIEKEIGDMFDSNVKLSLHFPELVPKELWNMETTKVRDKKKGECENKLSLPELLLESLQEKRNDENQGDMDQEEEPENSPPFSNGNRKRPRPLQLSDMVPVSLTIPYPETFIEQRLKYVKLVHEREKAIVLHQEAQEKLEHEQEEKTGEEPQQGQNPVQIPPIPSKPTPPLISELVGLDAEQYDDKYPIYFPKGKQKFVSHLDEKCFHISEGRYFGLSSNLIADPHFVGPNAPGIMGLSLSGSTGLATASTSSGNTGALLAVPVINTSHLSSSSGVSATAKSSSKKESSNTSESSKKTKSLPTVSNPTISKTKFKLKHAGPIPTATAADLRKAVDAADVDMARAMRDCIIRAAVHGARSQKHGQPFRAPDGKAYPDSSKAFAAHAGLKPCLRCKNNKQGVRFPSE